MDFGSESGGCRSTSRIPGSMSVKKMDLLEATTARYHRRSVRKSQRANRLPRTKVSEMVQWVERIRGIGGVSHGKGEER